MVDPPILWSPSPERLERANLTRYIRFLRERLGVQVDGYEALWRWSVNELEAFWASIFDFFEVRTSSPYERVLASAEMPGARWFPGAKLNYAQQALTDRRQDDVAIVFASEREGPQSWTWGQLRQETARIATGLRELGVGPGDRVVAYMPNIPQTVAAFLACASIGAIWSSCSPDFGARGVLDRFAQIEPSVLLAVDGYVFEGRQYDRLPVVQSLIEQLPSLRRCVLLGVLNPEAELKGTIGWERLRQTAGDLRFEQVEFEHPLWILYSSGTTGLPKAIVHSQGGIVLEHLKALSLHLDLHPGERMFWFTTTGWMMWNFLVGALLLGTTIILYDGSPGFPDMDALWQLAADTEMDCLGTSAGYISACMKRGVHPTAGRDLSRLQSIGSTGSTLPPEGFGWVYEELGERMWLFSASGGTDVCTAFLGGCPLLPVHLGELQCRALGADVRALDEQGHPVVGQVGELVIAQPMPSMPLGLWNDPDGSRYRESYFSVYPGLWRHGDWVQITPRGSAILYGRSDATINRGGVRMGSSEIYRAVLAIPEIEDALVVDVDGWMPLFVSLRPGATLDEALRQQIRQRIREDCSPRHLPSDVIEVATIPRTRTGKLLEVPVKRILAGVPPESAASREALADPDSLEPFTALAAARAPSSPAGAPQREQG